MTPRKDERGDWVCEHGTAVDVHCCNCHSGFIFDLDHECPDEEQVEHSFNSRTPYEPGDDRDIWCKDCEYHRDHRIHASSAGEPPVLEAQLRAAFKAGFLATISKPEELLKGIPHQWSFDGFNIAADLEEAAWKAYRNK